MGVFQWAQNSLERAVHNESSDVVLRQSRFWARSITWTLMAVTGFGLGWLALARTEEIVQAPGKLEPQGVVKEVQLPVGGVVEEVLVKEGDLVEKGQVLLRLDTEATRDRALTINKSIAFKEQQLVLKQEELARYLATNDTEQQVLGPQPRGGHRRAAIPPAEEQRAGGAGQAADLPGRPPAPAGDPDAGHPRAAERTGRSAQQADRAQRHPAVSGDQGTGEGVRL